MPACDPDGQATGSESTPPVAREAHPARRRISVREDSPIPARYRPSRAKGARVAARSLALPLEGLQRSNRPGYAPQSLCEVLSWAALLAEQERLVRDAAEPLGNLAGRAGRQGTDREDSR